ncbi:hypothetical protein CK556_03300 [Mesoplasma chauliocola]|uniref:tRNA-binding domain-containing protein n=1 Tax=Mesoplasma chauliocola TaxID=216427 RepID=A0A249SP02_9MOLU|nr:hypothetical protein [Mesoplasma chauliocola]ASZ09356.1 hypothetical protein CK556_03300 [Mesoplasma chauliocola]
MNKKMGVFFNKQFNCLLLSFDNKPITTTEKHANIAILKNKNDIVGINIFDVKIKIEKNYILNNDEIYEYISTELKDIVKTENLPHFIVGKIIKCNKIPDTHLSSCEVDISTEVLKIVCGAKNARENIYVVVATDGSWMPSGMQIVKGKLRGYVSEGMLCSARELQLQSNKFNEEGIIELDESYRSNLGKAFLG